MIVFGKQPRDIEIADLTMRQADIIRMVENPSEHEYSMLHVLRCNLYNDDALNDVNFKIVVDINAEHYLGRKIKRSDELLSGSPVKIYLRMSDSDFSKFENNHGLTRELY